MTAARVATVVARDSPMEVFLFAPAGAWPHPALVLCQHIPVGHAGLKKRRRDPEDR